MCCFSAHHGRKEWLFDLMQLSVSHVIVVYVKQEIWGSTSYCSSAIFLNKGHVTPEVFCSRYMQLSPH